MKTYYQVVAVEDNRPIFTFSTYERAEEKCMKGPEADMLCDSLWMIRKVWSNVELKVDD